MSNGSAASHPLLKAAPEPAGRERLGGAVGGFELALLAPRRRRRGAHAPQVVATRVAHGPGRPPPRRRSPGPAARTCRVDRLDDEAREQIERSAAFAAGIGSPVLTIHLYIPQTPADFRRGLPVDEAPSRRSSATSPTPARATASSR
jgi:hypothetical protein